LIQRRQHSPGWRRRDHIGWDRERIRIRRATPVETLPDPASQLIWSPHVADTAANQILRDGTVLVRIDGLFENGHSLLGLAPELLVLIPHLAGGTASPADSAPGTSARAALDAGEADQRAAL
jgi:hypothetical protein